MRDIIVGNNNMTIEFDSGNDLGITIHNTSTKEYKAMWINRTRALELAKVILEQYEIKKIKSTTSIEFE